MSEAEKIYTALELALDWAETEGEEFGYCAVCGFEDSHTEDCWVRLGREAIPDR